MKKEEKKKESIWTCDGRPLSFLISASLLNSGTKYFSTPEEGKVFCMSSIGLSFTFFDVVSDTDAREGWLGRGVVSQPL